MTQFSFGAGSVFATRTDVANSTPVQLGTIQDVSISFDFAMKELTGQYQFPVAVARAAAKITGKAKQASINSNIFNNFFFGQTVTLNSQVLVQLNEAGTIGGTPYQYTVTNSATFLGDLGVFYTNTGALLTKVASAPATGQYSVSAGGVYTFAAADTGKAVSVSYDFTNSTSGAKIAITNQLMGAQPAFQLVFTETFNGAPFTMILNQCISTKLSLDWKNEDFTVPEFDFSAFADAANNIGSFSMAA